MVSIPPILQGLALGACWKATEAETTAFMADYRRMSNQFPSEQVLLAQTLFFVGEVLAWIAANMLDRDNNAEAVTEIMLQTCRISAHLRVSARIFPAFQDARLKLESALEGLVLDNPTLPPGEEPLADYSDELPIQSQRAHAAGSATISIIDAWSSRTTDICIESARSFVVSAIIAMGDSYEYRNHLRKWLLGYLSVGNRFAE